jgi:hypothetical protein
MKDEERLPDLSGLRIAIPNKFGRPAFLSSLILHSSSLILLSPVHPVKKFASIRLIRR